MYEAPLERAGEGLAPTGEGWFVLNAREARWRDSDFGSYTRFEGEGDAKFPQIGINIGVLQPGQPACMYHGDVIYPASELAQRHGAGVEHETRDPKEAYAGTRPDADVAFREGWLPS